MAKTKEEKQEKEEKILSPSEQAMAFLKAKENRDDHYNFEETKNYVVKSSSLTFNAKTGGMTPGAHRAVGVTTGGKTSCSLDLMFNFFKEKDKDPRLGIYVKSEGRLSNEVKTRSGINFVYNPDDWKPGTCFVLESNVYETVFGFLGMLMRNNPTGAKYFIIIDSMDSMGKKDDLEKAMGDAAQVAGGALLTSVFLKKTSVALAKRGHVCIFISQVRDTIKIDRGPSGPPKQGGASGGHALEHAGDLVLEFQPRWKDDIIRENQDDQKSKILGHWCKIKIIKSNNEAYLEEFKYPIKYGRTGGQSVWKEKEIADFMVKQEFLFRPGNKGSWYSLREDWLEDLKQTFPNIDTKYQGIPSFYEMLEKNPEIVDYLYEKFIAII